MVYAAATVCFHTITFLYSFQIAKLLSYQSNINLRYITHYYNFTMQYIWMFYRSRLKRAYILLLFFSLSLCRIIDPSILLFFFSFILLLQFICTLFIFTLNTAWYMSYIVLKHCSHELRRQRQWNCIVHWKIWFVLLACCR